MKFQSLNRNWCELPG